MILFASFMRLLGNVPGFSEAFDVCPLNWNVVFRSGFLFHGLLGIRRRN
jgi:hypothetical protein